MKRKHVRRRFVSTSTSRYRPFVSSNSAASTVSTEVLTPPTTASANSMAVAEKASGFLPSVSASSIAPAEKVLGLSPSAPASKSDHAEVPGASTSPLPAVSIDNETSPLFISDRLHNIMRWLIFSVLIALLPIILVTISLPLHKLPVTFENTLSHGELLLVSTAILGEAIGDLILNRKANRFLKVGIVGLNVVVFGIACYLFADILRTSACNASSVCNASNSSDVIDDNVNALYSFSVFGWTLISGLSCKLAGEK